MTRFALLASTLATALACGGSTHYFDGASGGSDSAGGKGTGGARGQNPGMLGGTSGSAAGGDAFALAGEGGANDALGGAGAGGSGAHGAGAAGASTGASGKNAGTAGVDGSTGGEGAAAGESGTGGSAAATSGKGGASSSTGGTSSGAGGEGGAAGDGSGDGGAGADGSSAGDGAGGSGSACVSTFSVGNDGYVRTAAFGGACWFGYAFAGRDPQSELTPASFDDCGPGCELEVAGTVFPDPASYAYLGFNLGQVVGSATADMVAPHGTGISISYTLSGDAPELRLVLVGANTEWCRELSLSDATASVPYSEFKTACWTGGTHVTYAGEPVRRIELLVPGGSAPASCSFGISAVAEY